MASSSSTFPTGTSSPAPTNSPQGSGDVLPNNGNPTSLYLYTFVATLSILFLIFGILVARSIHMRRRRNAAILAAIAAGTYVPPPSNHKRRDDPLAPKPMLWEVHVAPPLDPEKGWAGMLPVAGAKLVPVTKQQQQQQQQQAPGHLRRSVGASWRLLRVPYFGRGRRPPAPPDSSDLPLTNTPTFTAGLPPSHLSDLPPPEPPSEPVHLAVLVSMPTRTARGRPEQGGPPVVEFGVAHVAYTHPTES